MKRFTSWDGPLLTVISKIGQILIINFFFLIGCIPVFTIGTSAAAMYYTIVKTVRAESGSGPSEFWKAYVRFLLPGILLTVVTGLWSALLIMSLYFRGAEGKQVGLALLPAYLIAGILLVALMMYGCPVISRFHVPLKRYLSIVYTLAFRQLHFTVILAVAFGLMMWALWINPIWLLVLPGVYCYLGSFLTESGLRLYLPPCPDPERHEWYYDLWVGPEKK